jgi:hypothetical protein
VGNGAESIMVMETLKASLRVTETKPYGDSTTTESLNVKEECVQEGTQNPSQPFSRFICNCTPKTVFVGFQTLKIGVLDAEICFNEATTAAVC